MARQEQGRSEAKRDAGDEGERDREREHAQV